MNEVLKIHPAPWRVADGDSVYENILLGKPYETRAEDTCILDANNHEVVGCSEWIRGDENFAFIVECVNKCAAASS